MTCAPSISTPDPLSMQVAVGSNNVQSTRRRTKATPQSLLQVVSTCGERLTNPSLFFLGREWHRIRHTRSPLSWRLLRNRPSVAYFSKMSLSTMPFLLFLDICCWMQYTIFSFTRFGMFPGHFSPSWVRAGETTSICVAAGTMIVSQYIQSTAMWCGSHPTKSASLMRAG